MLEEGSDAGSFKKETGAEYTGEINLMGNAHGIGVMKDGYEFSGSWSESNFNGYGEEVSSSGPYRGQWEINRWHGYGEWVNDKGGKFQGQWVKGNRHGNIRYTAPDGTVRDTKWHYGKDSGEQCNADDAVKKAEEGRSVVYLCLV